MSQDRKKTVYYAHSMHLYNTPQEERDIRLLESLGFDVFNPNQPAVQAACDMEKAGGGSGMKVFEELVRQCDLIAFRAHIDGSIPAGVYCEVTKYGKMYNKPVIELPWGMERRGLGVTQTREILAELGQR